MRLGRRDRWAHKACKDSQVPQAHPGRKVMLGSVDQDGLILYLLARRLEARLP